MKGNLFHQMQFKIWKNNHNFYNFTDISVTHFVFNEKQSRFQQSHRQYARARVIVELNRKLVVWIRPCILRNTEFYQDSSWGIEERHLLYEFIIFSEIINVLFCKSFAMKVYAS